MFRAWKRKTGKPENGPDLTDTFDRTAPSAMKVLGLDTTFYRNSYVDLRKLSDSQLIDHFDRFGRAEGRIGAAEALREEFVKIIPKFDPVLEIGPFCNPCVSGRNVFYFDVLDGDGLRQRAEEIGYEISTVPEVHFVSPIGDLSVVERQFSAVVSSHCIEHQPDLIDHLSRVQHILTEGGCYFLLVPDKRYCFDYALAESNLAQILAANRNRRRTHRLESVIEHRALTTHNDSSRHWAGDHFDPGWDDSVAARARASLAEFDAAEGGYIDVHAWQFTPNSFAKILNQLRVLELTDLEINNVYETPFGRNEFTAVLKKRN